MGIPTPTKTIAPNHSERFAVTLWNYQKATIRSLTPTAGGRITPAMNALDFEGHFTGQNLSAIIDGSSNSSVSHRAFDGSTGALKFPAVVLLDDSSPAEVHRVVIAWHEKPPAYQLEASPGFGSPFIGVSIRDRQPVRREGLVDELNIAPTQALLWRVSVPDSKLVGPALSEMEFYGSGTDHHRVVATTELEISEAPHSASQQMQAKNVSDELLEVTLWYDV